jgi:ABC-type transport system substrate-binding protein
MKLQTRLIVALALLVAACSPTGPSERPADTVVIGIQSDIQSWNPFLAEDATSEELLTLIYPSLAVEQVDYRQHPPSFAPALAESWEFSEDGLSLTFRLQPDAVWSDGVPVTSGDLLFSWRAQTSEALGWLWSDITDNIDTVEALDEHTVRYTFTHRYPYQLMDVNDGPIVPAHAWKEIPFEAWEDTDWSEHVVSAGPFVPVAHTPQQEIIFERNPSYFISERPRLARLVFRVVPSKSALFNQFLAGGIDLVNDIPPAEAARSGAEDFRRPVLHPHLLEPRQRPLLRSQRAPRPRPGDRRRCADRRRVQRFRTAVGGTCALNHVGVQPRSRTAAVRPHRGSRAAGRGRLEGQRRRRHARPQRPGLRVRDPGAR